MTGLMNESTSDSLQTEIILPIQRTREMTTAIASITRTWHESADSTARS